MIDSDAVANVAKSRVHLCGQTLESNEQGSIAEGRIVWRSEPIGSRWRRPRPVTGGASTSKFDFAREPFFNQRYRPVGNPIGRRGRVTR